MPAFFLLCLHFFPYACIFSLVPAFFLCWHYNQFLSINIFHLLFFSAFSCACFFFLLCPFFFSGAELHFVFCFFLFPFLACLSELTEMLQQEKFHTVERNRSYLQVLCSHFYSFHLFHCNFLFILNDKYYFKGDLRVVDHWKGELVYNFSNKMISFFPFFCWLQQ